MAKEKIVGACHLCGTYGELSFEHVPPKSAFNDRPLMYTPIAVEHNRRSNRGMGGYTLCVPCNNKTGAWYGNKFVEFVRQLKVMRDFDTAATHIIVPIRLQPLPAIKQIIVMAASANMPEWTDRNAYLRRFLLDRECKYLPPSMRVFLFMAGQGNPRLTGESMAVAMSLLPTPHRRAGVIAWTEIVLPPAGYIVTTQETTIDRRWVEITHFANFDYDDHTTEYLDLPVLDTHIALPGDYRTRDEIDEQAHENQRLRAPGSSIDGRA